MIEGTPDAPVADAKQLSDRETAIALQRVTRKASISRLKPLLGRAQDAMTWVVLAQAPQRTRGTLAWL